MPAYKDFEDLPVWRAAQALAIRVYQLTAGRAFQAEFALRDQLRRSALSIASNIAEGFERGTKKEFAQFLRVARGSAGELRSQLSLAGALGYLKSEEAEAEKQVCRDICRQLTAFAASLRQAK